MRIATLQFAPKLGDVEGNIKRADELLSRGKVVSIAGEEFGAGVERLRMDVLVLPELVLTGYNFPSLESIKPYLEPAGKGRTAQWARETARRLKCKVCVGYPEIETTPLSTSSLSPTVTPSDQNDDAPSDEDSYKCYNSLLVVDENGEMIHNYRKAFLYYTDETWAAEGDVARGFRPLEFEFGSVGSGGLTSLVTAEEAGRGEGSALSKTRRIVPTSFGICMDINPYKFEAPFTAWEFANRVLESRSQLVIVSMAWLTLLSREELDALAGKPELDTFNYWIRRFWPLIERKMTHDEDVDGDGDGEGATETGQASTKKVVIVFANRTGEEAGETEETPPARYAGTSAIVAVTQRPRMGPADGSRGEGGEENDDDAQDEARSETAPFDVKILCWDLMGATEEGVCFADTTADPKMVFGLARRGADQASESGESD